MYPSLVPFPSSSPELIPILIVIFIMLKNVFILVPLIYVLSYAFFKIYLFYFILFIYFLAVLHLLCCTRTFSSCGERGLLFVAVRRLLMAVAFPVVEHGL